MFETARAVTDLVLGGAHDRHPNVKLIVLHAGATLPMLADRIAMATTLLPDLGGAAPASVKATLGRLYYDLAGAPVPRLLPALQTFADPTRLLYRSDWPFTPEPAVARPMAQLKTFLAAEPVLLADIARTNASRLFPRLR